MALFTGLVAPSPRERATLNAALPAVETFTVGDLDDWRSQLTPANDPRTWYRWEQQQRNDCQPHTITGGMEIIAHRTGTSRKGIQLSRAFAYNACEELSNFNIGSDQGTTMQSGVRLATEIGAPPETNHPYEWYTGNRTQWAQRRTQSMPLCAESKIAKATQAPAFATAVAGAALGHPIPMGFFWPIFQSSGLVEGKKLYRRYTGNHGDGGHAILGAWPVELNTGELLLLVINHHGDEYFLIDETFYEQARSTSPFGMFQIYGSANPVAAYYDHRKQGLFSGQPAPPSRLA